MNKQYAKDASISLKQLSYLLAIADTLNFTRAAEQCFVTQSTLSGGLSELERVLGVQLVERDRQRVALTPLGANLVRRAQGILSATADLVMLAQSATDPASGELRLGIIPTVAPFLLGNALNACKQHFPHLRVSVRESQTAVLLAEVDSGELDAAVLALPIETGKLHEHVLFEEQLCLVAHNTDPLCKAKQHALAKIDAKRLLLLEKGHCLRDHTVAACSLARNPSQTDEGGVVQATNLSTMVQLVNAGIGCALLPRMAIEAGILNGTQVQEVPLSAPVPSRAIALVTRTSHPSFDFIHETLSTVLKGCKPT